MPVILTAEGQEKWLHRDTASEELKELLTPFPASEMKSFPVHSRVGNAQINEAHLIEPVDPIQEMTTGMLF